MNWLNKIIQAQIPGQQLEQVFWFHGTDAYSAYNAMKDMFLKPRKETGESNYTGSLSSIQNNVYLTANLPKAIKHALDKFAVSRGNPVVLVVRPQDLGYVHVDEDFVHAMLTGKTTWNDSEWYPSPRLEKEVFELADEITRASDMYGGSAKRSVLRYFRDKAEGWSDTDFTEQELAEHLQEQGIVSSEESYSSVDYDECMETAKSIASTLNDKHQKEAIMGFQNLAHVGQVKAYEIYMIPKEINMDESGGDWWVDPRNMMSYEDLKKHCQKIDPRQLIMSFMTNVASNCLGVTKTSATLSTDDLPDKLTQAIQYTCGGKWTHGEPYPWVKKLEDITKDTSRSSKSGYSSSFWIICPNGEPLTNRKWGVNINYTVMGSEHATFDSSTGNPNLKITVNVQLAYQSSWTNANPYALLSHSVGSGDMKTIQEVAEFVKESIINSNNDNNDDDDDNNDNDDPVYPAPQPSAGKLEPVLSNWIYNYKESRKANGICNTEITRKKAT